MSKHVYDGDRQFKPISSWGYIGYSLLFLIPVVGFILLIVFSSNDRNINRRNYARSYFCWILISIIIGVLAATGVVDGLIDDSFKSRLTSTQYIIHEYVGRILGRTNKSVATPSNDEKGNTSSQNNSTEDKSNVRYDDTMDSSSQEPAIIGENTIENSAQETTDSSHEYTLRDGKYIIGKDIAPGSYIISCTDTAGESVGNAYGSIGNMMDTLDGKSNGNWSDVYGSLGNLMGEYINMTIEIIGDYGDVLRSYEMKKGETMPIQLEEGTALQITDGSCIVSSK